MKKFIPYLARLQELASTVTISPSVVGYKTEIVSALNGQPSAFLRSNISLSRLRASGAFFTDHKLANRLALPLKAAVQKGAKVCDPACGAGDLLLAHAKFLPVFDNLERTLAHWGSVLYGYDIHDEFVRATKLRLVIMARTRCQMPQDITLDLDVLFPNIVVKNFLSTETIIPKMDIFVLNPPYTRVTEYKCGWAAGLVSCAGLFVAKCVEGCYDGTIVSAILPDVLRTGSRYQKWREFISSQAMVEMLEIVGKFDTLTDIDVFLIRLRNSVHRIRQVNWNLLGQKMRNVKQFGDFFDIRVGPVVPFRDIESGEPKPYIDAKEVVPWKIIRPGKKQRKYNKKLYKPPFIVVKRTSGPCDKSRAVASIVIGRRKIAVENHLIIMQPKNKSLEKCRNGLRILKSEAASEWFNKRIRCRHLTIASIAEMPWLETKK